MTIRDYYEQIRAGAQVRKNLSLLRDELKKEKSRRELAYLLGGDFSELCGLLADEDPKVRRNAAAILGKMESEDLLPILFDAYQKEETLFVRADYLRAMSEMDYRPVLPGLEERLAWLRSARMKPEEQKHLLEEQRVLQTMVLHFQKREPHTFTGWQEPLEIILVTNRCLREITARQISRGKLTMLAGGVRVQGACVNDLKDIRTYREMLFPVTVKTDAAKQDGKTPAQAQAEAEPDGKTPAQTGAAGQDAKTPAPAQIRSGEPGRKTAGPHAAGGFSAERAQQIGASLARPILELAGRLHEGGGEYLFRIEWKSALAPEKKGAFLRRISDAIEQASGGRLINSVSDYELEVRLLERKDGSFVPMLRLSTIPDTRFSYRREVVASSIAPSNAALTAELARPYLKEGAQVLDPFCGVGTMLIERDRTVKAGIMYGIDIYGEAVMKARVNTKRAGCSVYYINKDFFEFEHGYLFDEIITDLPQVTANHSRQQIRHLYWDFFAAAGRHLKPEAVLILYTTEPQLVLEALRDRAEYRIAEKYTVNEKNGTGVFIIERHQKNMVAAR